MRTFFRLLLDLFILGCRKHRLKLSSRAKLDLVASDVAWSKFLCALSSGARYRHLKGSKISKSYNFSLWEMLDEEFVQIIKDCQHIRVWNGRSCWCNFFCKSLKADFSVRFCWGIEFCRFSRFEKIFPLNDVVLDCHDDSWLRIKAT